MSQHGGALLGEFNEKKPAHGLHAAFRHDEAATARIARLKPIEKCEGESDE